MAGGISMLWIKKGKEPVSLTQYRKQPFAYYDGCNKEDIRKKLLVEQGYLCAYCMRRIDEAHMKIEHWYPEAELDETGKLDYENMLGVCMGHIEGLEGRYDTCDSQKGSQIIAIDPRNAEHIQGIGYQYRSGEIYSEDSTHNEDLNSRLNLNCHQQYLPENRKAVLDEVIKKLSVIRKQGTWKRAEIAHLRNIYASLDQEGKRKEYAGIVLWYLDKKMKR